jgi:predicted RNA-binding protein YlqC (UPF0109 family)
MIKKLVEYIVKAMVERPEAVFVQEVKRGDIDCVEITVNEEDRGKVIGREGQTIKALRGVVASIVPADKKVIIDLVQP